MEEVDVALLLEDLKDFYVWKRFANDDQFVSKWIQNRDELLTTIQR